MAPIAVQFEHVSLAWDEQIVLRDVSFVVPAGSTCVLMGASGTGKTTILKMILGLRCSGSSAFATTRTGFQRSSRVVSADEWGLPGRWPRVQACCCSMIPRPAWTRFSPRRWTTRS